MSKAIGETNIGLTRMLDVDKLFEKQSAAHTKHIERLDDAIELNSNKKSSAIKLQNLIRSFKAATDKLATPITNSFEDKKGVVKSTTDAGIGSDYISVRAEKRAPMGELDIGVQQLATAAKLVISNSGAAFSNNNVNVHGLLTLSVAGNDRIVQIEYADSVANVVQKINDEFTRNNDAFQALATKNNANTSYIEIKAKNTGVANIAHTYNTLDLFNPDDITAVSNVAGQDAIIVVDGVTLAPSASNKITDIVPGVTIELLKKNAQPGGVPETQTIAIEHDSKGIDDKLGLFKEAYNQLALFVAKQSQQVGKFDPNADPYQDQGSIYAEDAHLHDELILSEAKSLLEVVISRVPGNKKYSSLAEIGIGLETMPSAGEDNAEVQFLTLKDASLYEKAIKDNFEDVRALFMNTGKVISNAANHGSSMYFTSIKKRMSADVLGKDIAVAVTLDNAGAVTAVSAIHPDINSGAPIAGKFTGDNEFGFITFDGTILEGLELGFYPKGVTNHQENFTVNVNHGMADLALYQMNQMVSEDGKSGSVIKAIAEMTRKVSDAENEKDKVQETIDKIRAKLDEDFNAISVLEIITSLQMDAIRSILDNSSASAA